MTHTEIVAEWGTTSLNGFIPHKLDEFFAKMNEARLAIPAEYRDAAEIDCTPEYEFGESYARVRVSYERPLTDAEAEAARLEDVMHWLGQKREAVARVAYCERELELRK